MNLSTDVTAQTTSYRGHNDSQYLSYGILGVLRFPHCLLKSLCEYRPDQTVILAKILADTAAAATDITDIADVAAIAKQKMQKRTVEDTDRESSLESRMNMLQTTDIIAPPVEDGAADFLTRYIPLRFRSTSDFASSSTIGCYPNHHLSTYLVPIPSTEDTIAVYDKSLRAGVMAFIAETDIRWSMIGIVRAGRRDASGPTRSEGETTFLRVAVYPKSINVEMAKKIVSGLYALLHRSVKYPTCTSSLSPVFFC